jgi:endonuclease/exonuclease/phosphatase family metal-dependent hydrolase
MKIIKRIFKGIALAVGLFLLYVLIVIVHGTLTDFEGSGVQALEQSGATEKSIEVDSIFSAMIWNVGYAGLGKETAFFYDQGKMLHAGDTPTLTPRELVEKNGVGTVRLIEQAKAELYLLQEVDVNSKRSYNINAFEEIQATLTDYQGQFAVNYNVKRVPIPIFQPFSVYGKVYSGLASYSKYKVNTAERHQLPGSYEWPNNIFQLDRCLLVQRIDAKDKELVVVNVHNSAYDKGGVIKAQQMEYIRNFCLEEYEKGNYVLLGGDWNQCPPDFPFDQLAAQNPFAYSQINIEKDFLPNEWTWCYDQDTPTNRKNRTAYVEGESFVTIIDFFLISPNIEMLDIETIDMGFDYSDHQPVRASFKLL